MKTTISILLLCVTVLLASCQKKDSPAIPVAGITISKTTLSIVEGEKEALSVTITPVEAENKSVTWMSSDINIVTISTEGVVTAVREGIATITVTSVADNTKTASCTVTVLEKGVGDFYMADGSIIGKDATLTDEQKAKCLGIIFKMGRSISGRWADFCDYKLKNGTTPMPTVKGYVLALSDANNGNPCQWGPMELEVGTDTKEAIGFLGYDHTQAIIKVSKTQMKGFPATYQATEAYEAEHHAPANSSGWFLPSAGECQYWLDNQETILASIRKVTTPDYDWLDYYWSSSEYSDFPPDYALFLYSKRGVVYSDKKDVLDIGVRACLAF